MKLIDKHKRWIDGVYRVYLYAKSSSVYCRNLHEGNHVYSRHLKELRHITFAYSVVELNKLVSSSNSDYYSVPNYLKECLKDKYKEMQFDVKVISSFQSGFYNMAATISAINNHRDNLYAHTNPRNIQLEIPGNIFDEIERLLELIFACINYLSTQANYFQMIEDGYIDLTGFHVA